VLVEETLFGTVDKVADSIQLLRDLEPPEGYYLAFSGGKDSIVIKQLAIEAKVKFDAHYSMTTIDPPELIYFMREHHPDIEWVKPEEPFVWKMVKKGFPQRQRRWCCELYKENGGDHRVVITGVRAAESAKRAKRKHVELCYKGKGKRYVNPILTWTDDDVWNYIKDRNLPYCSLYDEGWHRIGCLMCPFAGFKKRQQEADRYPGFKRLFIEAFKRLYIKKKSEGKTSLLRLSSGLQMFWWWLGVTNDDEDPDQTVMFE